MKRVSRVIGAAVVSLACLAPPAAFAQPPQPQQQDEFVPLDQLPAQDQLPAAPLLIAAYSFVALALFTYMVSISRRLGRVQNEIARLETDLKKSGRG
jgi:CcmD family protein